MADRAMIMFWHNSYRVFFFQLIKNVRDLFLFWKYVLVMTQKWIVYMFKLCNSYECVCLKNNNLNDSILALWMSLKNKFYLRWFGRLKLRISVTVHNAVVTAAVFAPNPSLLMTSAQTSSPPSKDVGQDDRGDQVLVTADFSGAIKVVQNTSTITRPPQ